MPHASNMIVKYAFHPQLEMSGEFCKTHSLSLRVFLCVGFYNIFPFQLPAYDYLSSILCN